MITSIMWALLPLCAASAALSWWLTKHHYTRFYTVLIEEWRERLLSTTEAKRHWISKYIQKTVQLNEVYSEYQQHLEATNQSKSL